MADRHHLVSAHDAADSIHSPPGGSTGAGISSITNSSSSNIGNSSSNNDLNNNNNDSSSSGAWTEPPWSGWIETTGDALLILEAARRGIIPRVTRRLVDSERKMITSGSVFVFDEEESGIKRWTDGFFWSPSRILGNFLLYRETDKKGPKRGARVEDKDGDTDGRGHSLSRPKSEANALGTTKSKERDLVGSLTNSEKFKPDGLMKKTFSLTIQGVNQHLISYYKIQDVENGRLRSPSSLPELAALDISAEYLDKMHFRNPPKVEIGTDGRLRYRGEADDVDSSPSIGPSPLPLPPVPVSHDHHLHQPHSHQPYQSQQQLQQRQISHPSSLEMGGSGAVPSFGPIHSPPSRSARQFNPMGLPSSKRGSHTSAGVGGSSDPSRRHRKNPSSSSGSSATAVTKSPSPKLDSPPGTGSGVVEESPSSVLGMGLTSGTGYPDNMGYHLPHHLPPPHAHPHQPSAYTHPSVAVPPYPYHPPPPHPSYFHPPYYHHHSGGSGSPSALAGPPPSLPPLGMLGSSTSGGMYATSGLVDGGAGAGAGTVSPSSTSPASSSAISPGAASVSSQHSHGNAHRSGVGTTSSGGGAETTASTYYTSTSPTPEHGLASSSPSTSTSSTSSADLSHSAGSSTTITPAVSAVPSAGSAAGSNSPAGYYYHPYYPPPPPHLGYGMAPLSMGAGAGGMGAGMGGIGGVGNVGGYPLPSPHTFPAGHAGPGVWGGYEYGGHGQHSQHGQQGEKD